STTSRCTSCLVRRTTIPPALSDGSRRRRRPSSHSWTALISTKHRAAAQSWPGATMILRSRSDAMTYSVKEIFYTLQGEGVQAGRPAVFCRFAGCNLWSGLESDRAAATCKFCDTDFIGTNGQGG